MVYVYGILVTTVISLLGVQPVHSAAQVKVDPQVKAGPEFLRFRDHSGSDASSVTCDAGDRESDGGLCACEPFGGPGHWCRGLSGDEGDCDAPKTSCDDDSAVIEGIDDTLSLNGLEAQIPEELVSYTELRNLFLRSEKITSGWEHLPLGLRFLSLERCCVSLPRSLVRLVGLECLELSHVGNVGIRGGWSNIPLSLKRLDLVIGHLHRIPVELSELENLSCLRLSDVEIEDLGFVDWIPPQLRVLIFRRCNSPLKKELVIPSSLLDECSRKGIKVAVFHGDAIPLGYVCTHFREIFSSAGVPHGRRR